MRFAVLLVAVSLVGGGCAGVKSDKPAGAGAAGNGADAAAGTLPPISGAAGTTGASGTFGTGIAGTSGAAGMTVPMLKGTVKADVGDSLTVSGKPAPAKFDVTLASGSTPTKVVWTVDDTRIGSIGDDGVFHANGFVGGVVTVTATVGSGSISTQFTVNVDITENPGNVPAADQTTVKTGGQGDAQWKLLYPYDRTVFPRGLAPPVIQLGGAGGATSTYLKITAPSYSYQQFAAATNPVRVTLPEQIWKGLALTAGATDTIKVEVSKLTGGAAAGPATQSWIIAQASIKGIVYYNTYKSPLAQNGGVMRIPAGKTAEVVVSGCTVCHSVSANGNVLAAGSNNTPDERGDWNPVDSASFDLTAMGMATQKTKSAEGRLFSFMALTPDGKLGLVNGLPPKRWPPFIPRGVYASTGVASKLVDTASGADVAAPSLAGLVQYATMPAFSPDGAHVAFANSDKLADACLDPKCDATCLQSCQRVLTVLDFDGKATPPAFSNARDVVTQAGAGKAIAWPSFLPDGRGIVFHEGDSADSYVFTGGGAPSLPQYAELRLVDTQTKMVKTLNAVNGRTAAGDSYLPNGDAVEGRMNYEPSVLPVPLGGYYWVLFTSRRTYGNTISPTSTSPSGANPWGTEIDPSPRKKLWIAAIDIDHPTKTDPSHPAFYLPGQELESGNMRAFAALAPCKAETASCETGADCCGGFCREVSRSADGVPSLACVPPPMNMCSNTYEPCKTAMDCCDPKNLCINGRCAQPAVVVP
jgi:hypothetical protein